MAGDEHEGGPQRNGKELPSGEAPKYVLPVGLALIGYGLAGSLGAGIALTAWSVLLITLRLWAERYV